MKIGTITFYKAMNYGAFLQCFALQKVLKGLGHDTSVIKYENPLDIERYKNFSLRNPKGIIKTIVSFRSMNSRRTNFRKAQALLSLSSISEDFDVAITGSDQVWNPNLCGGRIDEYFSLEKINAHKKVAYAASIGEESVVRRQSDSFEKLLNGIDYISVREDQAKKALQDVSNKEITVTVDPTALLNKEEWLSAINHIKNDETPYILSYFMEIRRNKARALSTISRKTNLKVISYSQIPIERHIYKKCFSDGPFEFLARLRDAKLVITSSFHGTILSIILHKNFYVLMPNKKRRSRIDNILELVGLTDRVIETEEDIDRITLKDINYAEPQRKLNALRQESLDWLKDALED